MAVLGAGGSGCGRNWAPGAKAIYDRATIRLGAAATPDTAYRALGCAVLDMLRPELWDVATPEADALYAAFAEATAQLAALAACGQTVSTMERGSPDGFSGAFASTVRALVTSRSGATLPGASEDNLRQAARAAARLMVIAARRVPVAPNLLAQFAAELVVAAAVDAGPELAAKLRGQFAAHGLLARVPALDHYDPHEAEDGTEIPPERHALPWVAVTAPGLALPLLLCPASQQPRLFAAPPRAPMARPRTRSRRSPKPAAMRRP